LSHLKERKEKNCLNCNAEINGRFCSVCGQENVEPAESAWHLVTHFFNDITHFDGKFFSTLKFLIFKPGFLSSEYRAGRRASYLNPVRMYVFTSAIFFLVFFSVYHFDNVVSDSLQFNGKTEKDIAAMDSSQFNQFTKQFNNDVSLSREEFKKYRDSLPAKEVLQMGREYKSRQQYDSLQATDKVKDSWFMKRLVYKKIEINEKYKSNPNQMINVLIQTFIHNIPQMLFVSLPLFALFLKLMYNRNKKMYYASHAIFSIHFYIFIFIDLLAIILLDKISELPNLSWLSFISILLFALIFFYEYKAMRNFYAQRRAKTVFKFIFLNMWLLFIVTFLFVVFSFLSFLKV
jgi:hypothetical protein